MSQMPTRDRRKFYVDKWLLGILLALIVCSLIAIYCADPIMASHLRGTGLWMRQGFWFFLGFLVLGGLLLFGIDRLFSGAKVFYWILMVMLVLLLLDKYINLPLIRPVNGTRAWFQFPLIGSFQPSEFMKIVLILITASIISEHNKLKTDLSFSSDISLFIKIGMWVVPPLALIVMQPDTGIPIIIMISILVMLAVSGIRKEWIWAGVIAVVVGLGAILFLFEYHPQFLGSLLGSPYKLNRFYGWLQTEKYIGSYGNQLYTALLTLGSAGLSGHGLREALIYFAEPQTDFIFAVIGQNFGFLGTSLVVFLSTAFDIKLMNIAMKHDSSRERLVLAGMLGMLVFQQFQNMGMITGLLPITGITLPFISYGGSSMLSYMIPLAVAFYASSEYKNRMKH